ncbi:MAG: type II toxin-antitoxin system MqsA family antitoxin [Spirochaetia bacterium]|jgi:HTH-type transcriptional regulator/antitoxin MqsA
MANAFKVGKSQCPECGAKTIHDVRDESYTYRGKTHTFKQPGTYCTKCDNCDLSPEEARLGEREIQAFKRGVDKELTELPPSKIRAIREELHLTQKEASELFGGGVMAFSKYERGEYNISEPLDLLLKSLICGAIRLDDLRKVKSRKWC